MSIISIPIHFTITKQPIMLCLKIDEDVTRLNIKSDLDIKF